MCVRPHLIGLLDDAQLGVALKNGHASIAFASWQLRSWKTSLDRVCNSKTLHMYCNLRNHQPLRMDEWQAFPQTLLSPWSSLDLL